MGQTALPRRPSVKEEWEGGACQPSVVEMSPGWGVMTKGAHWAVRGLVLGCHSGAKKACRPRGGERPVSSLLCLYLQPQTRGLSACKFGSTAAAARGETSSCQVPRGLQPRLPEVIPSRARAGGAGLKTSAGLDVAVVPWGSGAL